MEVQEVRRLILRVPKRGLIISGIGWKVLAAASGVGLLFAVTQPVPYYRAFQLITLSREDTSC
jgi:hypothetical protein